MNTCRCGDSYLNLGFSNCPTKKFPSLVIIVPYLGSDGSVNRVDLADLADPLTRKQYFIDKLNAPLPEDRWFPLANIKNPDGARAASDFETFSDKSKQKIRDGIRNYTFAIAKGSPQLLGKLKAYGCSKAFGLFIVDIEGNLNGIQLEEGFLEPYPVDVNTWDIIGVWAAGDVSSKVQVNFDFQADLNDEDERMLSGGDLAPANLKSIFKMGLLDVFATFGTNATTKVVTTLVTKDGSLLDPIKVQGLVIADFVSSVTGAPSKVRNTTTNADITITSVTVDAAGNTYTINFAAQTAGDTIVVDGLKPGLDFSEVALNPTTL